MTRLGTVIDDILKWLTDERGHDVSAFRGAQDIEIYRDNEYFHWIVSAQAMLGLTETAPDWGGGQEADLNLPVRCDTAPVPGSTTEQLTQMARVERRAFLSDARFFDEEIRGNLKYAGEWVAVSGGEVVDHDTDVRALIARLLEARGPDFIRRSLVEFVTLTDAAL